jgi:hypothetical protein
MREFLTRILADALEQFFNGSLDDVRIYNRALSAAEISSLYNGGAGCQ